MLARVEEEFRLEQVPYLGRHRKLPSSFFP
jgi:hypothetical protein